MMPTKAAVPPRTFDIRYLKGVGPKRALALEKLGIHSVRDLLYFFPRRYEDRSQFRTISELTAGESVTFRGEVLSLKLKPLRRMPLLEITVGDKTGMIHAVWFNQPYLKNQFAVGQEVILFGKIEWYKERLQVMSPEYEGVDREEETVHTGRVTPVYPLTEGLFQRSLRTTLKEVVETQLEKNISEYLPEPFREEKNLMELRAAIRQMHFPDSLESQCLARRRMVFDEFFLFQITLFQKLEKMRTKYRAYPLTGGESLRQTFEASLPLKLTPSQARVISELTESLRQSVPINRLLQGDVGSGKTLVAAFALLLAAKNGHQGICLVPTELLAEQHYRTLAVWMKPFGLAVGLLTASTLPAKKERMMAELRQGKLNVLVGTHALFQENVRFPSLALVVIDEQHKFGVHQRCRLLQSDPRPHQLVMTATPIPRTLALTLYGDLEVSVLRELPAGRQPIKTYWVTRQKRETVLHHIGQKVQTGEQAYFVFPSIEETEKPDLLAAKREYENLRRGIFRDVKMGLVHGRLTSQEREAVMQAFREGKIQVLAATSVVEVGVDNPNATIMVIENAERFGLSQLHQMRGRIGRGTKPSECFLFGEPKTLEGQKRLRILTKTQNGFLIAEEDLRLRGPGDFWGTRQSGEPLFRVADPVLDEDLLQDARQAALRITKDHELESQPNWHSLKNFLEENPLQY